MNFYVNWYIGMSSFLSNSNSNSEYLGLWDAPYRLANGELMDYIVSMRVLSVKSHYWRQ